MWMKTASRGLKREYLKCAACINKYISLKPRRGGALTRKGWGTAGMARWKEVDLICFIQYHGWISRRSNGGLKTTNAYIYLCVLYVRCLCGMWFKSVIGKIRFSIVFFDRFFMLCVWSYNVVENLYFKILFCWFEYIKVMVILFARSLSGD